MKVVIIDGDVSYPATSGKRLRTLHLMLRAAARHQITYVGRVEPAERDRLLAGAAALLYPLQYPEPFGLVMTEAMACGTPVLGVGIGAVPELVEPGLTPPP